MLPSRSPAPISSSTSRSRVVSSAGWPACSAGGPRRPAASVACGHRRCL